MPSVIKVDQIQSDSANVIISGSKLGVGVTSTAQALRVESTDNSGGFAVAFLRQNGSASGGNGLVVDVTNTPAQYVADFRIGNQTKVAIDSTGAINLASGQIKFPATQVASSDPNTLDDYEEGSWTPSINGGSSNGVLTNNSSAGSYIKIGSMVWVHCQLHFQCTTAGSGAFSISNLPFVAAAVNGHGFALALGALYNWNIDNSAYQLGARVNESTSSIFFWNNIDNSTDALLSWPFAGGGTQVFGTITGCYRAAS